MLDGRECLTQYSLGTENMCKNDVHRVACDDVCGPAGPRGRPADRGGTVSSGGAARADDVDR